jgi:type I restriction enzyme, S subunit
MKDWKPYTFSEAVECSPKISIKKGDVVENCEMEDIEPNYRFLYPREGKLYKGSNSKFQNGDTVFARITPCLENGKIAQIKGLKTNQGIGSTEFFVFRGKNNISDNDFVFYLSKTNLVRDTAINSMTGASGRQRADIKAVKKIPVNLPALKIQHRIASILSAYDDLIEVNNQRIKLLELTARELYKEWFVRMRFPDYKKTKFKKGIPEGWEVKTIRDIAIINKKNLNSKSEIKEVYYIDISSVSTGRVENTTTYSRADAPGRAKRIVGDGDTIFSTVRPENRAYSMITNPIQNTIASTGFAVLSPIKKEYSEFIYFIIASDSFIDEMTVKARGSAYPQIGFDDISRHTFLFPKNGNDFLMKFHSVTNPMFQQIETLQQQNTQLRQIRDRLLPRLISGKLQVKETATKKKVVI